MKSLCSLVLLGLLAGTAQAEDNWVHWRGPHQNGVSSETDLPEKWNEKSVTWKTLLPGEGQSVPCIWGEKIFLTSALDRGAERVVLCLNRNSGQILWQQTAWQGQPEESHKMNGWASASCTTDGELVYAFFGKGGLHAYTVNGEHVWSRDLGVFVGPWGTAATPVLVGDLLIQNCDADENAYLLAVDKKTGETKWKVERDPFRGWSTPVVIEVDGHQELVLNGHMGTRAYDPNTGEELWFVARGGQGRGEPTATPAHGLLYVMPGKTPGDLYAIKPGGEGTVTTSHTAWHTQRKGGRDLPSPIVVGDYVLVINMMGIMDCYDAHTGKELWKERIGGSYSASPVSWNGLAFFISEQGETVVIKPGPKANIVARNTARTDDEEIFRTGIVPLQGQLFIRSTKYLYCLGDRTDG